MQNVRKLALDSLKNILRGGRKPRETLEGLSEGLSKKDRAFLMETTYGVLRQRDRLDWIINRFLKRSGGVKGYTRDNLRLGIYEIFHMRVPDWAAVDEAVKLERRNPSLVNAILRNAIRDKDDIKSELDAMRAQALNDSTPLANKALNVSVLTSHPVWLARRWIKRFGAAEALALAEADNRIPPLTLRVNSTKTTRDKVLKELKEAGIKADPTEISPQGIRLKGTIPIGEIAAFMGKVYIQDEAAQLVSQMLEPKPGERVLDACAAPGGKTTHIADLMGDTGEVVAVDSDEKRIKTLKENIEIAGLSNIKVIRGDITSLKGLGLFDRVLVDAPCSATGVIRRKPDVKYRHRAGDLLKFRERQLNILRSAAGFLKPKGILVYCTCSTELEEGEQVIREFLKTSGDFINIKDVLFGQDFMRTYPHRHNMDGFFAARLKRLE